MKHIVLIVLVFLLALAGTAYCGKDGPDLYLKGSAGSRAEILESPAFNAPSAVEASILLRGKTILAFLDPDYSGRFELREQDPMSGIWESRKTSGIPHARFPYTFQDGETLYTAGMEGNGLKLWSSADGGLTWEIRNGGSSILTLNPDPESQWHQIWNVALVVQNGTVHAFAETAPGSGQDAVALTYTSAPWNPDSLNLNPGRADARIIEGGGNPYATARSDGSILLLYGAVNRGDSDSGNFWFVTYATNDGNPGDPSQWVERQDVIKIGSTKAHVADPHALELPQGETMISFSFDQLHSVTIKIPKTLMEL